MPLGPGQDALGSVLLIGRFFTKMDGRGSSLSPAGEITIYKSLSAFYLLIKLIHMLADFYICHWFSPGHFLNLIFGILIYIFKTPGVPCSLNTEGKRKFAL